ncbi:MAG: hypothetical protein EXR75_04690 [Myxococcales bacterium]|nr:hypothetical protein [Myxococcales bacterium]
MAVARGGVGFVAVGMIAGVLTLVSCSAEPPCFNSECTTGGPTTSASTGTGGGGGGGPVVPAESCVQAGEKGNNNGVGEFCTPGGGECADFPKAALCLADVGQSQWMCTRIGCDATTDCGAGAGCHIEPGQGSACLPCKCDPSAIGCNGGGGGSGSDG